MERAAWGAHTARESKAVNHSVPEDAEGGRMNRINGSWLVTRTRVMEHAVATVPAVALSLLLTSCGNASPAHSMRGPTVGTLVTAGSMTVRRSLHTATLLSTGEVLLAGGGTPEPPATRTVEIFDPRTGQTRTSADMNVAREDHTATLLPEQS